jgi:hypothetical protein
VLSILRFSTGEDVFITKTWTIVINIEPRKGMVCSEERGLMVLKSKAQYFGSLNNFVTLDGGLMTRYLSTYYRYY